MSYGIVQMSGSGGAVTPWVNVTGFEETSEAFILHIQAAPLVRWVLNTDLLYVMKPKGSYEAPTVTLEDLEEYRAASGLTPNYSWHADTVALSDDFGAAEEVWPPPPIAHSKASAIEVQVAGTMQIAIFNTFITDQALVLDFPPAIKLQSIAIPPFLIFVFLTSFLIMVAELDVHIAALVALASSGIFGIYLWRSSSLVRLDRERSLVILNGSRFASIFEVASISVIDRKGRFGSPQGRKRAYIEMRKTDGKVERLSFEAYIGASETNLIAMLLGQYLAESQTSARGRSELLS